MAIKRIERSASERQRTEALSRAIMAAAAGEALEETVARARTYYAFLVESRPEVMPLDTELRLEALEHANYGGHDGDTGDVEARAKSFYDFLTGKVG